MAPKPAKLQCTKLILSCYHEGLSKTGKSFYLHKKMPRAKKAKKAIQQHITSQNKSDCYTGNRLQLVSNIKESSICVVSKQLTTLIHQNGISLSGDDAQALQVEQMFEERLKDSPTEHRHPTEHRQPAQTEKDKNKMLIFNSLKKKVTFSMENPVHVSSVCIRDPSDIEQRKSEGNCVRQSLTLTCAKETYQGEQNKKKSTVTIMRKAKIDSANLLPVIGTASKPQGLEPMNRILAVSKPTRKHLINEKVHYIGITGKTSTSNHLSLNLMATLKILKHPNIFSTAHKEKSKTSHQPHLAYPKNLKKHLPALLGLTNTQRSLQMKIIAYQLFRGLSYLHARNIVHCEIVPHSILLGSGCQVAIGEFRKSRFTKEIGSESVHEWTYLKEYRAPELILGAKNYLPSADIWSAGIILAELTTGHPPFIEDCDSEMIVEMTKILGRPSKEQVQAMYADYDKQAFIFLPARKASLTKVLKCEDELRVDLLESILQYSPAARPSATTMLAHMYFDELRDERVHEQLKAKGYSVQHFFTFSASELQQFKKCGVQIRIVPEWTQL